MGNIEFAWDRRKASSNLAKHGISFEGAKSVFLDENARLLDDPDHSDEEDRFVLLGYSFQARCRLRVVPRLAGSRHPIPTPTGA